MLVKLTLGVTSYDPETYQDFFEIVIAAVLLLVGVRFFSLFVEEFVLFTGFNVNFDLMQNVGLIKSLNVIKANVIYRVS